MKHFFCMFKGGFACFCSWNGSVLGWNALCVDIACSFLCFSTKVSSFLSHSKDMMAILISTGKLCI